MAHVVGAAIIRGRTVLAARRTAPAEVAGSWEFPGGKVEPGESADRALVREIAEELGCEITVTGWLSGTAEIPGGHTLQVAFAELSSGRPVPHEHDAVAWLTAEKVDSVQWLAPDRPFLAEVRERLASAP